MDDIDALDFVQQKIGTQRFKHYVLGAVYAFLARLDPDEEIETTLERAIDELSKLQVVVQGGAEVEMESDIEFPDAVVSAAVMELDAGQSDQVVMRVDEEGHLFYATQAEIDSDGTIEFYSMTLEEFEGLDVHQTEGSAETIELTEAIELEGLDEDDESDLDGNGEVAAIMHAEGAYDLATDEQSEAFAEQDRAASDALDVVETDDEGLTELPVDYDADTFTGPGDADDVEFVKAAAAELDAADDRTEKAPGELQAQADGLDGAPDLDLGAGDPGVNEEAMNALVDQVDQQILDEVMAHSQTSAPVTTPENTPPHARHEIERAAAEAAAALEDEDPDDTLQLIAQSRAITERLEAKMAAKDASEAAPNPDQDNDMNGKQTSDNDSTGADAGGQDTVNEANDPHAPQTSDGSVDESTSEDEYPDEDSDQAQAQDTTGNKPESRPDDKKYDGSDFPAPDARTAPAAPNEASPRMEDGEEVSGNGDPVVPDHQRSTLDERETNDVPASEAPSVGDAQAQRADPNAPPAPATPDAEKSPNHQVVDEEVSRRGVR